MVPFTPPKSPTHLQSKFRASVSPTLAFTSLAGAETALSFLTRAEHAREELKSKLRKGQKRLSASFTLFPLHGLFSPSARRRFHVS